MFKDFISLLFPRCCVVSNEPLTKGEQFISTNCAYHLPKYNLYEPNESLSKRFLGVVNVKHAFAYYKFAKKSRVQKLIHHIKYKNGEELGELVSRWYGNALIEAGFGQAFDVIVTIPLHKKKQRKRGYNQCDCIAKGLSAVMNIPWETEVLCRHVQTGSQTTLSRVERFDNAASVYSLRDAGKIQNKRVLLIDDVITTGATIGICADLLLKAHAKEVSVASLASPE